jgi:Tfp pilus assembly protein PilX
VNIVHCNQINVKVVEMNKGNTGRLLNDERGSTLIIVVIIIMVLTSLGLYGLTATSTGILSSATETRDRENFSNADSGLKFAIKNFNAIYSNSNNAGGELYCRTPRAGNGMPVRLSMGDGGVIVVTNSPCADGADFTALRDLAINTGYVIFDYEVNGVFVARIEIKAIMRNPASISDLSNSANNIPAQLHLSPPPSGYDSNEFKSRNYCITSTALDAQGDLTNTTVQEGVVMVAQKKNVDFLAGQ